MEPLWFVVACAFCGELLDRFQVTEAQHPPAGSGLETWRAGAIWAGLAKQAHVERGCPSTQSKDFDSIG